MTPKSPKPSPTPPAGGSDSAAPASALGPVKIQKREVKPVVATREKICATCGRAFRLSPDEKFFNCPHCYKKSQPVRKAPRKNEAQILTQITCLECGTQEYVDFVPSDPATALCAACFSVKKRELQAKLNHKERR
jgi:RNase P subunit RPR2